MQRGQRSLSMQTLEAFSCPWPLGAILGSSSQPSLSRELCAPNGRVPSSKPGRASVPQQDSGCQVSCRRVARLGWGLPSLLGLLACRLTWGILGMGFPLAGMTRRLLASRWAGLNGLRLSPSTESPPQGALLTAQASRAAPRTPAPIQAQWRRPQLSEPVHTCMRMTELQRQAWMEGQGSVSPEAASLWDEGGGLWGWCLLGSLVALPILEKSLSLTPISAPSGGFSAPGTLPRGGGAARSQSAWRTGPRSAHRDAGEVPAEGERLGSQVSRTCRRFSSLNT